MSHYEKWNCEWVLVVDKCVVNTWCEITCVVSYELYNTRPALSWEKRWCAVFKKKCRFPIQEPMLNCSAIVLNMFETWVWGHGIV